MKHRILFYSHDTFGLGHFRRSLTIASYLARHVENTTVLMLTGLDSAASFEAPRGVDFVKLPGIWKSGADDYRSRHLRVSFARVQRMRGQLIGAVVRAFNPSLFVVDNVPRGVDGELLPTLRYLHRRHPDTRIVLTLRDVLDDPAVIVPQWRDQGVYGVLAKLYDEIWVVGSQSVFDLIDLYEFPPAVASKVRFCGYIVRSSPLYELEELVQEFHLDRGPFVVASCGGGGDGYPLIDAYVDAAIPLAKEGLRSVVFLGPDMPPAKRRDLKRRLLPLGEDFITFDYRPDLVSFIKLSSACVAMAGYNTVCELLALRKPATVIPRVQPRVEQLLRSEAFADRGLLQVLHPDRLNGDNLRAEIRKSLDSAGRRGPGDLPVGMDFAGLARVTRRVRKNLGAREVE